MPITQDRLASLIQAAISYETAITELKSDIAALCARHDLLPEQRLGLIEYEVGKATTRHPVVIEEEVHYKLTHKLNERYRKRAENRRRAAGITPRAKNEPFTRQTGPTLPYSNNPADYAEAIARAQASMAREATPEPAAQPTAKPSGVAITQDMLDEIGEPDPDLSI